MQISCPAKINLFLKVLGKRNDGFHRLESLLAFTDLQDFLQVEKSEIFQLEINGIESNLIDKNNNLFTKIFKFFKTEFNLKSSVKINLEKNIPIGGGLGGGSSNAASFMILLNEIFQLNLDKKTLQKISLNFGSDIAFFFEDYSSIIKGRGEIIVNFSEFESFSALLINPRIHLSTKEIFENFNNSGEFSYQSLQEVQSATKQSKSIYSTEITTENFNPSSLREALATKQSKSIYSTEITTENLLKENIFNLAKKLTNDLENPAIKAAPQINEILENCKNLKAKIAKMSGSGSTCFAIFKTEENLKKAEEFFNKNFANYFVKKITISHKNPSKII